MPVAMKMEVELFSLLWVCNLLQDIVIFLHSVIVSNLPFYYVEAGEVSKLVVPKSWETGGSKYLVEVGPCTMIPKTCWKPKSLLHFPFGGKGP
jgi:hypothetical protein